VLGQKMLLISDNEFNNEAKVKALVTYIKSSK